MNITKSAMVCYKQNRLKLSEQEFETSFMLSFLAGVALHLYRERPPIMPEKSVSIRAFLANLLAFV